MSKMFLDAFNFDQDISGWDVSSVEDMSYMFLGALSFNQPLNAWNVRNVKYFEQMFYWAVSFSQPLDRWEPERIERINTWGMFYGADKFVEKYRSTLEKWEKKYGLSIDFMLEEDD